MTAKRVADDLVRLRAVVLGLARQMTNNTIVHQFLSNLNPTTSIDGRMPVTPNKVVVNGTKRQLVLNTLAWAVLKWGALARGEANEANPELELLESVVERGYKFFGAYPKDKGSPIMALRHVEDERKIIAERKRRQEMVDAARAARLERIADRRASGGEGDGKDTTPNGGRDVDAGAGTVAVSEGGETDPATDDTPDPEATEEQA